MQILPLGYFNAHFIFACDGVLRQLTWSQAFTMPDPAQTPTELADAIRLQFVLANGPCNASAMNFEYAFLGVRTQVASALGDQLGFSMVTVVGSKPTVAASLPPNCSILLQKFTARGGRRGRGRAFLPPYNASEGDFNAAGQFLNGSESAVVAKYSSAYNDLSAVGIVPVLLHNETIDPDTGEVDPTAPAPPAPDVVTSLGVARTLATQRRRMR